MTQQHTPTIEPTYGTDAYYAYMGRKLQDSEDAKPNEFWVTNSYWKDGAWKRNPSGLMVNPIYYGLPCLPGLSVCVALTMLDNGSPFDAARKMEAQDRTGLDSIVNAIRAEARARNMKRIEDLEARAALKLAKEG